MKLTRLILVCTLLLLIAAPLWAAPPCSWCREDNVCQYDGSTGERCRYLSTGFCETYFGYCIGYVQEPMLAEWNVASIEISRPALDSKIVTTPADVAEVRTFSSSSHPITEQK